MGHAPGGHSVAGFITVNENGELRTRNEGANECTETSRHRLSTIRAFGARRRLRKQTFVLEFLIGNGVHGEAEMLHCTARMGFHLMKKPVK